MPSIYSDQIGETLRSVNGDIQPNNQPSGNGGGTPPGEPVNSIQFNNNGVFGGIPGTYYANGNIGLGSISNLKISGGSNNLFVTTDGNGNLSFRDPLAIAGNAVPYIHFTAPITAPNQQFIDANLALYATAANMTVVKDGVVLEAGLHYFKPANNSIQITVPVFANSDIDVLPQGAGIISNGNAVGGVAQIVAGNNITLNPITGVGTVVINAIAPTLQQVLTTGNTANIGITLTNNAGIIANGNVSFTGANVSLGNVANLKITGGNANQFLQTDGNGNIVFANVLATPAGNNGAVQFKSSNVFAADVRFNYGLIPNTLSFTQPPSDTGVYINSNGVFTFNPLGAENFTEANANIRITTNAISFGNLTSNTASNLVITANTITLSEGIFDGNARGVLISANGIYLSGESEADVTEANATIRIHTDESGAGPSYIQIIVDEPTFTQEPASIDVVHYEGNGVGRLGDPFRLSRARNTRLNPQPLVGGSDYVFNLQWGAYTGNGDITVNGTTGWIIDAVLATNYDTSPIAPNYYPGTSTELISTLGANSSPTATFDNDYGIAKIDSAGNFTVFCQYANTDFWKWGTIQGNLNMSNITYTPLSTANGNIGDIRFDANYIYVCVSANTWKRSGLSSY